MIARVASSTCARASSHLGPIAVERDKSTDETPRRGAIVGRARLGEGDMHFGDPRLAPDGDDLARRDADKADQEHEAEQEADDPKRFRLGEQPFNEVGGP